MRQYAAISFMLSLLLSGCMAPVTPEKGSSTSPQQEKSDPAVLALAPTLQLASEPANPKSVIDLRKEARADQDVVIIGQIGGSVKPFTPGRASFLIVDSSLKPTEDCDCPWDFCGVDPEELKAARALVRFVDGQGNTLKAGARELFDIKELSTVVIKGKAKRDDQGNVTILASALFVRKAK